MNVVLIGYRGTGKSTIGGILAARLSRTLVSTDGEVVKLAGQGIPEIVQRQGWDYFRNLESQVCEEISDQCGLVIDTGGGVILRSQNVEVLKKNGTLFWLTASVDTITKRIGGDTQRPSLTETKSFIEEIQDVLTERMPKYKAAADHVIVTDGRSLEKIADEILALL